MEEIERAIFNFPVIYLCASAFICGFIPVSCVALMRDVPSPLRLQPNCPFKKGRLVCKMKVALASDHAGYAEKERLKSVLSELGVEFEDLGTVSEDSVDYPDYARKVAEAVAHGEVEQGVLVCGSGTGMAIAANKV